MNKKLLILALPAMLLAACSSEDDNRIFSTSAAERLEAAKTDYKETLTANGGMWAIEYFTNDEEPGYLMVMQFSTDGAVTVHADHRWIGNTYKTERSCWDVLSDNGTVLTFNSYNTLFHVFSTPENIVGEGAPTNPNTGADINELGYGHEGDYEFLLFDRSEEQIRLVGKKHHKEAWLRHLDPSTDPKEYLAKVKSNLTDLNNRSFPVLTLVEPTGETYGVTNFASGIPSVYPYNFGDVEADPVTQTVKGNGIHTTTGFRFRTPLNIKRADGTEWKLASLSWDENGILGNAAGVKLLGPTPKAALSTTTFTWAVDTASFTGTLRTAFAAMKKDIVAYSKANPLKSIKFAWESNPETKALQPVLVITAGSRVLKDYIFVNYNDDVTAVFSYGSAKDKGTLTYEEKVEGYKNFKAQLMQTYALTKLSEYNPADLELSSTAGSFKMSK